ncbi:DUF4430 domain-containing protein [Clostridium ihumii]|uniref:DUF4430 domain-containing protein n=1 Tax=Clostridium ihumii TaxID=1470356 RepID=UPI003D3481E4
MKRNHRILVAIILSFIMTICLGCGAGNKDLKTSKYDNKAKVEKSIDKKGNKAKEKTDKKNEIKKENSIKNNTEKEAVKKEEIKKEDTKIENNNGNQSSEEKQIKENNNEKEKNETVVKDENRNNKVEEDTFTMIIGKDVKGYTGNESSVVEEITIKIDSKKSAMQYLRENTSMQENGGFIFEINGIHNHYPIPESEKTPEQKKNGVLGIDWFIYLNDKKTPVGANDVYPQKGDVLLFDFHEWDKREFLPPED